MAAGASCCSKSRTARSGITHEIQVGLSWLARSAEGECFSRYHAEAGIAAEHCLAPSFAETRWDRIVECYALLERLAPSAIHTLNRAVAVAEWRGPVDGPRGARGAEPPSWLAGSYLWAAVLADLHRRCGHAELAAAVPGHGHRICPVRGREGSPGATTSRRLTRRRPTRHGAMHAWASVQDEATALGTGGPVPPWA